MSRAEALAEQFDEAIAAFADYLGSLSPEQWRTTARNNPKIQMGDDEDRPVGVVAHHVGDSIPLISEIIRRRAIGEPMQPFTMADINGANAKHAAANPDPDQAETVAMIRDNAARASELVRSLSDDQLERVSEGAQGTDTVESVIRRVLIGHVAWHEGSIRATVAS